MAREAFPSRKRDGLLLPSASLLLCTPQTLCVMSYKSPWWPSNKLICLASKIGQAYSDERLTSQKLLHWFVLVPHRRLDLDLRQLPHSMLALAVSTLIHSPC